MKEVERVDLLACQKIPVKKMVSSTKIIQENLEEKEGLDFMFSIEIKIVRPNCNKCIHFHLV